LLKVKLGEKAYCSIGFKFDTEFHHVIAGVMRMFKVKGQSYMS